MCQKLPGSCQSASRNSEKLCLLMFMVGTNLGKVYHLGRKTSGSLSNSAGRCCG